MNEVLFIDDVSTMKKFEKKIKKFFEKLCYSKSPKSKIEKKKSKKFEKKIKKKKIQKKKFEKQFETNSSQNPLSKKNSSQNPLLGVVREI